MQISSTLLKKQGTIYILLIAGGNDKKPFEILHLSHFGRCSSPKARRQDSAGARGGPGQLPAPPALRRPRPVISYYKFISICGEGERGGAVLPPPPVSSITGRAAGPRPSAAARLSTAAPHARLMAAAPPPPRAPSAGRGREPFPAAPASGSWKEHNIPPSHRGVRPRLLAGWSRLGNTATGMAGGRGEPPRPVETTEPPHGRLFGSCQDLSRGGGAHRAGGGEARWRWRWR